MPPLVAAFLKRVPVILHEQNLTPGWANRFCALFAKKIAVSFPETEKFFPGKSLLVGNPVREELWGMDPERSRRSLGLEENRPTILVFGGSAGAKSINGLISESLGQLLDLREKVQFVHLTGNGDETQKLKEKYGQVGFHSTVMDYCDRMNDCYAAATFAVCRSGASTVAELIATRTPAILVPYPHAAGNHQRKNASFLEKLGCAATIVESEGSGSQLVKKIREMVSSDGLLSRMRENFGKFPVSVRDAARKLSDAVMG